MRTFLWIVGVAVLWPSAAMGGACSEFLWQYPSDMIMPHILEEGQEAMEGGAFMKAREKFSSYLLEHDEGVFAEGTKWAMAWLPDSSDKPGKEFLDQIERLDVMKTKFPDSPYAPWALCSMGQLYFDADWHSEADTIFEEFLKSYPDHPLAGGIMVETGVGYIEKQEFLEAAIILRRVVEEPKWEAHRLSGALGLAEATARSKAWKQAYYWYRVVEAESPQLIRQSAHSSYYYGLTEVAIGDPRKAIPRLLTTINLHPQEEVAGQAMLRLSEKFLKEEDEYISLWFADHAKRKFEGQEAGRRGLAAQTRWVVKFLSEEHSRQEWEQVYERFNELEIYLSITWDSVIEATRILSQAPEKDIVEESLLWMGQGFLALDDPFPAIESFWKAVVLGNSKMGRQSAQQYLGDILQQKIQAFYNQKAWVALLKFHEEQQEAFKVIPLTRERVEAVAQAYQHVNLPSKAMQWYDQLLKDQPKSPLREEIFAQRVLLAEIQGNAPLLQEAGEEYVKEYSKGQRRSEVSAAMGMESLERNDYPEAIQHFTDVLSFVHNKSIEPFILRQRAFAYQELGKRELALLDLRQVVAIDPEEIVNVVRLGDFLFDQGDFAEAESLYDQVLSSKAPIALKAWAKYREGLSLEYQEKAAEANKLFVEVGELETQYPDVENTIRAAAMAVLDEFSLKDKLWVRRIKNES